VILFTFAPRIHHRQYGNRLSVNTNPTTAFQQLYQLVKELFTPQELRQLVHGMPFGEEILNGISEPASLDVMAEGIVDALDRRGVLDELPDHMIAARPRRENEIRVIEYALSGERTAAGLLRTHALEELEAPSQPFFGSDVFTSLVTLPGGRMLLLWPLPSQGGLRVRSQDLRVALSSEVPVLMVAGASECSSWRWADAKLLSALGSDDVVIDFPPPEGTLRSFVEGTIGTVERPRWRWDPGAWSRLQERAAHLGRAVRALGTSSATSDALVILDDASQGIEDARFIVAVAGPYRAGKSTLINALLEVEVSPVSRRPTTAVPVEFENGDPPRAEIYFTDGKRQEGPAKHTFLEKYATQEHNRNNQRNVGYVRVKVPSPLLSQGVVLLDAPGFQDPSETMVRIAEGAIARAHAVLYVVDGAPFREGGYVLNQQMIDDIRRIGRKIGGRKLLLLVNKVDRLEPGMRDELAELLDEQTEVVREYLPRKPFFISAQEAWTSVQDIGESKGGLEQVHDALWKELLQYGEIGFVQLRRAVRVLEQATERMSLLFAAQCAQGRESERLRGWTASATATVTGLRGELEEVAFESKEEARLALASKRAEIVSRLRQQVRSVSIERKLPGGGELADQLRSQFVGAGHLAWRKAATSLTTMENRVADVIETELKIARMALDQAPGRRGIAPPSIQLNFRSDDGFQQGVSGGFLGSLFGGIISESIIGVIYGGIAGFLASLLTTRNVRRQKDLVRLDAELEEKARQAEHALVHQLHAHVDAQVAEISRRLDDRLQAFISVMNLTIRETGAPPASAAELQKLAAHEGRAVELRKELELLVDEIYCVGMESSPPPATASDSRAGADSPPEAVDTEEPEDPEYTL